MIAPLDGISHGRHGGSLDLGFGALIDVQLVRLKKIMSSKFRLILSVYHSAMAAA